MNYIIAPKLFNTGFIPHTSNEIRIRQGLTPQDVTNACMYDRTIQEIVNTPNQCYPLCNKQNLYPAKQVVMNYDTPSPNDNCICLRYVQPP